ncbi:hypothetical protein C731_1522 [Mycolicibacterium hassiacum DSM 44199]|uniref:Uncharacterized protein n=1 Tax=Mycolicibacterium hassiacum (strain DSM 44199 / CIP 105218 / JCM 12690 / 3849) TaxID=1122247 RepID=K5B8X4_MYCHD|nr:hypothetical protein C731_1522 [Mycolicibacterium hassiacum DSM 44199]
MASTGRPIQIAVLSNISFIEYLPLYDWATAQGQPGYPHLDR